MNQYFGKQTSFAELREFLKDKNIQRIRRYHLDDLRNHAVFHFRVIEKLGAKIAADTSSPYVFAVIGDGTQKQVYYPSADVHALEILIGVETVDPEFWDKLTQLMKEITNFAIRFLNAADEFIVQNLMALGFYGNK